jgi:hypothetical protein
MSVHIGVEGIFDRTIEILKPENKLPPAPYPMLFGGFDRPMPLWGPLERPEFVIDESELPY